jgi:hypothetical protein
VASLLQNAPMEGGSGPMWDAIGAKCIIKRSRRLVSEIPPVQNAAMDALSAQLPFSTGVRSSSGRQQQ